MVSLKDFVIACVLCIALGYFYSKDPIVKYEMIYETVYITRYVSWEYKEYDDDECLGTKIDSIRTIRGQKPLKEE